MTITSKLLVRTLVVLTSLFIFVKGLWLNFTNSPMLNLTDRLNTLVSLIIVFVIAIVLILIIIVIIVSTVENYINPFIKGLWTGEIQLFKPFTINFKFKKKHD